MISSLRSIILPGQQLALLKDFYSKVFGKGPYFDEPFYVGFDLNGDELGLDPNLPASGQSGPIGMWKTDDIQAEYARLLALGARENQKPTDVGGGMMVASVLDPMSNVFGLIQE